MAKQPKLNYDCVETLYLYGYNTKEIAALLGSVNGHISKVLRHLGVATRKRGEVVAKTAYRDMDSDAQTLLKDYQEQLQTIYKEWASRPVKQTRFVPSPEELKKRKEKKAAKKTKKEVETEQEAVVTVQEVKQEKVNEASVEESGSTDEAVADNKKDEDILAEMDNMLAAPKIEEIELEDVTEDGISIVRGEAFKAADLQTQGKIIQHFMSKGMAQRPIAKELGVAQSSISKIWGKYRKEVK